MYAGTRFRPCLPLFLLYFIFWGCLGSSTVNSAAPPVPGGETPLPAPRPLPASTPRPLPAEVAVEEQAPAPREVAGPIGLTPPVSAGGEAAPMPHEQTPGPPPLILPSISRAAPPAEVQRLHQEIESLSIEREAMLVEEMDLITAKDMKVGKGDDGAKLRRRVTELLIRAAQRSRKATTPEESVPTRPEKSTPTPQKTDSPKTTPSSPSAPSAPATPSNLPVRSQQPAPIAQASPPPDRSSKVLTEAPVDPLSLAQSLFLAGEHTAALTAYRKLEQNEPKVEERVGIQYMIACCLRKLGKLDEAAILYREVANSGGGDILVENAQWYLRAMKDRRELETQLDELRQRRQTLVPRKP